MRAAPGAAVFTLARSALPRGMSQRKKTGGGVGLNEQGTGGSRGDPCLAGRNGRLFEHSKTLHRYPHALEKRGKPHRKYVAGPLCTPLSTICLFRDMILAASTMGHLPCTFFPSSALGCLLCRLCSCRPLDHFHRRDAKVTQAASLSAICGLHQAPESSQPANQPASRNEKYRNQWFAVWERGPVIGSAFNSPLHRRSRSRCSSYIFASRLPVPVSRWFLGRDEKCPTEHVFFFFFLPFRRHADWIVTGPWVIGAQLSHRIKRRQALGERATRKRKKSTTLKTPSDPVTKNATIRPYSVIVVSRLCTGAWAATREGSHCLDLHAAMFW